ncbi:DUF2834 domain-containing protein [Vibrio coralliilyticus]|uniref:DUF2834 domain-containing protein n=1 Tax=Vibrio coralliilyticus TaxID=190893 RepID=UPI001E5F8C9B|nr:DUF2834 domain-containing protein [Vibrio coralliilyticus]MCC2520623.1 DUF2834 domain-containing protein [Vibrio coralliilyticus]
MARLYLVLAVIGVTVPYAAFAPWLLHHGLNIPELMSEAMAYPLSQFAWLDVIIAAIALIVFILVDGKRLKVKGRNWAIAATLCVGVSCGLPLYLYLRERQLKAE